MMHGLKSLALVIARPHSTEGGGASRMCFCGFVVCFKSSVVTYRHFKPNEHSNHLGILDDGERRRGGLPGLRRWRRSRCWRPPRFVLRGKLYWANPAPQPGSLPWTRRLFAPERTCEKTALGAFSITRDVSVYRVR
jgi:hypothetical protein